MTLSNSSILFHYAPRSDPSSFKHTDTALSSYDVYPEVEDNQDRILIQILQESHRHYLRLQSPC